MGRRGETTSRMPGIRCLLPGIGIHDAKAQGQDGTRWLNGRLELGTYLGRFFLRDLFFEVGKHILRSNFLLSSYGGVCPVKRGKASRLLSE